MTYLSPLSTAVVRMPETSEPASGSVRQKEASSGASVRRPRYSRLISSEPPIMTGVVARPLQPSDVWMPEHPHESSSSIRSAVEVAGAGPPYSSGMWEFIRPTSHAFSMISCGQVPSRSYSHATGRISLNGEVVRHLAQILLLIGEREIDHVLDLLTAPTASLPVSPGVD